MLSNAVSNLTVMKFKSLLSTLWMVTLLGLSLNAQSENPQINGVSVDKNLVHTLENNHSQTDYRVIITFKDADLADKGRTHLLDCGGEFIGPEFRALPIQGVQASEEEIYAFTEIEGVIGIWQDRKMQSDLHQAVILSSVKDTWEDSEFTTLNDGLPVLGRGVGVLVNDSGFDGMDTDLEDGIRIVQNVKGTGVGAWVEDTGPDNDQGGGHGSHCMGIVGGDGSRSNGKITGVAPKAQLIGYGSGAGLLILDVTGGFEYIAQHGRDYNIRVMSNSYGTTADTTFLSFDPTHPTNVATKALTDQGVVVVFSAGNSGPEDGRITGVYKTAPWVITVGNGEKDGTLANSSSRGRPDTTGNNFPSMRADITFNGTNYLWENRPTITAPGSDIVSVRATSGVTQATGALGDLNADLTPTELPYYNVLSGTSMACPHVAGIVALMLEANPKLEWRACKAIIQRTAITSMPGTLHERGAGFVNANAAVAAAFHGLCDVPEGSTYEQLYGLNPDESFGFDSDVWKSCPLNAEVLERLKTVVPTINGVESECGAATPPLTDSSGDGAEPYKDVTQVDFTNETATTFDIVMTVAGNLALAPTNSPVASGTSNFWDVHFTLDKAVSDDENELADPPITYIVSSTKELAGEEFVLTVKTGDGTTRPSGNAIYRDAITGSWDTTNETITWTVDKSLLNYRAVPATGGAADVSGNRTGRPARRADELARWKSYTYERVGSTTPDGAGVYDDDAEGACFKVLAQ